MRWLAISACFILLLFDATSARAWAPEQPLVQAVLGELRLAKGSKLLNGLDLRNPRKVRISIEPHGTEFKAVAQLRGRFTRAPNWTFVWQDQAVGRIGSDDQSIDFSFEVPIRSERTAVQVNAVGPDGELESASLVLIVPEIKELIARARNETTNRSMFFASLGPSYITYTQDGKPNVSQIGLNAKLAYQYVLVPPRIDIGLSAYMTLLPVTSSPAGLSARFLGINLRSGYLLPVLSNPWQLSIAAGWYYVTMYVPTNDFGFTNLSGPQLFPVLKYIRNDGDTISTYVKFSPVSNQLAIMDIASREIAAGFTWVHVLKNKHPISFALDFANVKAVVEEADVNLNSMSASVGYGW